MKYKVILILVTLLFSLDAFSQGCPVISYNTNVSEFDSTTVANGTTIFPVGGSGITNGSFAVCDHPGVQIGGRISERFVGQITPVGGNTADYIAPIGAAGDGNAKWNVEGHIDFGYATNDGGTPPESLADVQLSIRLDCSPYIDIVEGPTLPLGLVPQTAVLLQFSENIGFSFACQNFGPNPFDPNVDGHYAMTIVVADLGGQVLAELQVNAIVGNPVNAPKISAAGIIESQVDGIKFPDGTIQTTAAVSSPAPTFPSSYIRTASDNVGGVNTFIGCDAGDQIIGGGARCHAGSFNIDRMHKTCPANAAGACQDSGGTDFVTWAAQCDGDSQAIAYAICLDTNP